MLIFALRECRRKSSGGGRVQSTTHVNTASDDVGDTNSSEIAMVPASQIAMLPAGNDVDDTNIG